MVPLGSRIPVSRQARGRRRCPSIVEAAQRTEKPGYATRRAACRAHRRRCARLVVLGTRAPHAPRRMNAASRPRGAIGWILSTRASPAGQPPMTMTNVQKTLDIAGLERDATCRRRPVRAHLESGRPVGPSRARRRTSERLPTDSPCYWIIKQSSALNYSNIILNIR